MPSKGNQGSSQLLLGTYSSIVFVFMLAKEFCLILPGWPAWAANCIT